MKDPSLIEREHKLLTRLARQAEERAQAELSTEAGVRSREQQADKLLRETRRKSTTAYETKKTAIEREYEDKLRSLKVRFESRRSNAEREYASTLERLESLSASTAEQAKAERREARWMAATVHETSCKEADKQLDERRWQVKQGVQELRGAWEEAVQLLTAWRQYRPGPNPEPSVALDSELDDDMTVFENAVEKTQSHLAELKQLFVPKLLRGNRPFLMGLAFWAILIGLGISLFDPLMGLLVATTIAALLSGIAGTGLYFYAKSAVAKIDTDLRQSLADAKEISKQSLDRADRRHKAEKTKLTAQRDDEQKRADDTCLRIIRDAKQTRDTATHEARERYPRQVAEIERSYHAARTEAQEKYPRLLEGNEARYQSEIVEAEEHHRRTLAASNSRYEEEWHKIVTDWRSAVAEARSTIAEVNDACEPLFPQWGTLATGACSLAETAPPVIHLGQVELSMRTLPHGFPAHPRLDGLTPEAFTLPALLPLPSERPLLLTTDETGCQQAIQALHAFMLRLLTSLPPGKVRFSIVDPVGLGQNFAAFMRLTDYDEALVSKRIWTEPEQIERRLADLTEHMENVIQKYLRNEFENIEDYNLHAGEVAESYRFLVIADFGVNLNDEAVRRLERIMTGGPRCGVHTLMVVDTGRPLPKELPLAELEQQSEHLAWSDGALRWKSSPFEPFPLALTAPPITNQFIQILERVGQAASDAKRVEVPFDVVLPPRDQRWSRDSREGIRVPLGKVGANRLQHLGLGQGTSQHVLIAGKTGSGKSTLLNVLITNLAFHYSPEQVELYLVDFKKGVEFKAYATAELPHARVIAVESDREFGLSVLERLDGEIQRRGEAFRRMGVQDLAAYREAEGDASLPRVLLIVDEFQEFFVEDDRIAQDASLLLDRLVRQGRAFGIHVLLGSQTISGAYSLARSTLSQLAVRIALECSETDAHLILNEDNTAAATLSRPGEAIYNDAGGLVDGNSPFQTAWLPDAARETYLNEIREMARSRSFSPPEPQVVFEGNVPADVTGNRLLAGLLQDSNRPVSNLEPRAWLGDAVAIKEPTSVVLRRQSGSNLLLVGQQAEGALAILTTSLISLAAEHAPTHEENGTTGARFYLLDATNTEGPVHQHITRLAGVLPFRCEVAGARDLARVLAELAAEVEDRQQAEEGNAWDVYLLLYDVGRFRDLRRNEDDLFSSSLDDEPAKPPDQLAAIIRDGPPVGVHTLVWCDSLANLNRTLDRAGRREFDSTVLFQMSADDSSSLIDSPQANKLGPNRALLYNEEQGRIEKFRPYALPSEDWLAWVREQFLGRDPRSTEIPKVTQDMPKE